MAPTLNETLCPKDHPFPCDGDCGGVVAEYGGRFYVTLGHAGFNTPANNRDGYATRAGALGAFNRCNGRTARIQDQKTAEDIALENACMGA